MPFICTDVNTTSFKYINTPVFNKKEKKIKIWIYLISFYCIKSVQILSYLRSLFSCIQFDYRKYRPEITLFRHLSRSVYGFISSWIFLWLSILLRFQIVEQILELPEIFACVNTICCNDFGIGFTIVVWLLFSVSIKVFFKFMFRCKIVGFMAKVLSFPKTD